MRTLRRWIGIVPASMMLLVPTLAMTQGTYHGRKAWTLQNDRMQVVVTPGGGHIASMTLKRGRGARLNPLWLPPWPSIEPNAWSRSDRRYGDPPGAPLLAAILGHNLCLDFFGAPSAAEARAGIPVHGEAPVLNWSATERSGNRLTCMATLPHAQMKVVRTLTLRPGSTAVWITESVTNLSAMDRPFGWQQHVTFGPPFLQTGATFFDMPAGRGQVYPKEFSKGERLQRGAFFEWPEAPARDGETVDLRAYPTGRKKSSDFFACVLDPGRTHAWFTAINTKKGLLCGYLWPRTVWPWMGVWEENHFREGAPWRGKALTRGMEFGTTPFPDSRRDAVRQGSLLGTPTYRWISARATQTVGYAAFLAPIPPGTTGVKDVTLQGNVITITLDGVDRTIRLPVARSAGS